LPDVTIPPDNKIVKSEEPKIKTSRKPDLKIDNNLSTQLEDKKLNINKTEVFNKEPTVKSFVKAAAGFLDKPQTSARQVSALKTPNETPIQTVNFPTNSYYPNYPYYNHPNPFSHPSINISNNPVSSSSLSQPKIKKIKNIRTDNRKMNNRKVVKKRKGVKPHQKYHYNYTS
jgi:hypothetical protein